MKQREILLIVGSFFFLVLLYLGLSIYHNYITSTIPEELDIQITPISPTFDSKTITDLRKRTSVLPLYQTTPVQTPQPQIPQGTQQATKSASQSAKSL